MPNATITIFTDYIEIQADTWDFNFIVWLHGAEKQHHFTAAWDRDNSTYRIPLKHVKEAETELRRYYNVNMQGAVNIPREPVVIRVEYLGACKRHLRGVRSTAGNHLRCPVCGGSGIMGQGFTPCNVCQGTGLPQQSASSYASAWVNGGWNVQFPESVLREYFVDEGFDGNFHKALLRGNDINKVYKQLARRFHPDVNRSRKAHEEFVKLKAAFDDLRDPMRRKRYEAGLKFQQTAVEEVVFRTPVNCGDVEILGEGTEVQGYNGRRQLITVHEILSWKDVVDPLGRVMVSTWNGPGYGADRKRDDEPPFVITWEYVNDYEVEL